MRWFALVVLLVGCDRVFDLPLISIPDAPPPDVVQPCPVVDEFDKDRIDLQWATDDPPSSIVITETAGDLVITPQPSSPGYNGIHSIATHDLTGMIVHVQLRRALDAGPGDVQFVADIDHTSDDNYYMIFISDGAIGFRVKHGTIDEDQGTYSPTGDQFLRMRFDAGGAMMMFETSRDDLVWSTRKTVVVTVPIRALHLALVAGTYNGGYPSPGEAHFDHFSVCPTP